MAGDRVSAELGIAVKANAQNATADAVVIWRIVFIVRSNQFEALGVFRTSRPSLIWSPGYEWLTGNIEGSNRSSRWSGLLGVSRLRCLLLAANSIGLAKSFFRAREFRAGWPVLPATGAFNMSR